MLVIKLVAQVNSELELLPILEFLRKQLSTSLTKPSELF